MMDETPRPLEPFDEIDRAELAGAGFAISDDNRCAWVETEVLIQLTRSERRVHYRLLIKLPSGAVVEADAPWEVLRSDAEIEQTIADLAGDDRCVAYADHLRQTLDGRRERRNEPARKPETPHLYVVE